MVSRYAIYRSLLRLYPKEYQAKYSDQMLQTLEDMLDDQFEMTTKKSMWLRAYTDLSISIAQQNITTVGGIIMHEAPSYIKKNALVGTALIMPFFVLVWSGLLQKQWFVANHLWTTLALCCLILLPALAFLLNAFGYIEWLVTKTNKTSRGSFLKRMFDIRHTYPAIAVGLLGLVLALFVPFHDSAHCVIGNPVRIAHNPHQTMQCINNGYMGGK